MRHLDVDARRAGAGRSSRIASTLRTSAALGAMLAACAYEPVDLNHRPCSDGRCGPGFICREIDQICVPFVPANCSGGYCPSRARSGDACAPVGAMGPCHDDASACERGCRACGEEGWRDCTCKLGTVATCGSCDEDCRQVVASAAPACRPAGTGAVCDYAGDCHRGFADADGVRANGCECVVRTEVCDGADNDCDHVADENAADCTVYYRDGDRDGLGDPRDSRCACRREAPYDALGTEDCDAFPLLTSCTVYYKDADGDDFGAAADSACLCAAVAPYDALRAGDCDDGDSASHAGAPERCDGNDNDCDGQRLAVEVDLDEDGYVACVDFEDMQGDQPELKGGRDCMPDDPLVHPPEQCAAGWDCDPPRTVCASVCGDGQVVGHEPCDDGNAANGDGCAAACQVELGWGCRGEPSLCSRACAEPALVIGAGAEMTLEPDVALVIGTNGADAASIQVDATAGFAAGDEVLIVTSLATGASCAESGAGAWQLDVVVGTTSERLHLARPLARAFSAAAGVIHQVVRVPSYAGVTLAANARLTARPWDGARYGVLALRTPILTLGDGASITMDRGGYRGGYGGDTPATTGTPPEGPGGRTAAGGGNGGRGAPYWDQGPIAGANGAGGGGGGASGGYIVGASAGACAGGGGGGAGPCPPNWLDCDYGGSVKGPCPASWGGGGAGSGGRGGCGRSSTVYEEGAGGGGCPYDTPAACFASARLLMGPGAAAGGSGGCAAGAYSAIGGAGGRADGSVSCAVEGGPGASGGPGEAGGGIVVLLAGRVVSDATATLSARGGTGGSGGAGGSRRTRLPEGLGGGGGGTGAAGATGGTVLLVAGELTLDIGGSVAGGPGGAFGQGGAGTCGDWSGTVPPRAGAGAAGNDGYLRVGTANTCAGAGGNGGDGAPGAPGVAYVLGVQPSGGWYTPNPTGIAVGDFLCR